MSVLPTIRELSRGWHKSKCRVLPLAVRLGVPRAIPKVGIALLVGFSDSGIAIGRQGRDAAFTPGRLSPADQSSSLSVR